MIFIFTLSVCCCGLDMFAATPRSWLIKQKHLFAFKFKFMGNVEYEIPLLHVPVKVTFNNVLVWFLIWSNGRGAGRLVCTTKWEINNRQTPNGAILLCQAFFHFLPKTKSIIKHLFRGNLFRDNKFETFWFNLKFWE